MGSTPRDMGWAQGCNDIENQFCAFKITTEMFSFTFMSNLFLSMLLHVFNVFNESVGNLRDFRLVLTVAVVPVTPSFP